MTSRPRSSRPSPAIGELYRRHAHVVLRRARRLLGDEEEAREVLHDLFAKLVAHPEQLDDARRSVTGWFYVATTHACLARLRDGKNRTRLIAERLAPALPRRQEARAEDLTLARQLLARLPDELAAVAWYYHVDGMTQREIGELLGCSHRHVGNLVGRANSLVERAHTPMVLAAVEEPS